jgi:hypothetical protein
VAAAGERRGPKTGFAFQTDKALFIDNRGMIFSLAFAAPKKLGAATFYLVGGHDSRGQLLDGQKNYVSTSRRTSRRNSTGP